MSRISQLIDRLWPEGVKYIKLVKVANTLYGYPFDSNLFSEDDTYMPLIRIRDVVPGKPSTFYLGDYSNDFIVHKGDILVGMDGNFNLSKWNDRDGLLNQRVCKISTKDENNCANQYLYHLLGPLFKHIEDRTPAGSVKHLSAKSINDIIIPLPPIEVQQEIVRILDSFTGLIDNLNKELEDRKKQFEYYLNKLVIEDNLKCPTYKLGDIGTFTRGNGLQKKDFTEDGFPCIHYGQIHTRYNISTDHTIAFTSETYAKKLRKAQHGDLLIATTSEDVDACCKAIVWSGSTDVAISGDMYVYHHTQNSMYMEYLFQTAMFYKQKQAAATGAKVVRVSGDSMAKFEFPFPSMEKQKAIADKLNNFAKLIYESIPSEISHRQKQYEYYRDQLLNFKRKEA